MHRQRLDVYFEREQIGAHYQETWSWWSPVSVPVAERQEVHVLWGLKESNEATFEAFALDDILDLQIMGDQCSDYGGDI